MKKYTYLFTAILMLILIACSEKSSSIESPSGSDTSYSNQAKHGTDTYLINSVVIYDFGINQDNYLDQDILLKDASNNTIAYLDLKATNEGNFVGTYSFSPNPADRWLDIIELTKGNTLLLRPNLSNGTITVNQKSDGVIALKYSFSTSSNGTYSGEYKGSYTTINK